MKAFLLAGGNGTRLRPLTDSVPKCLVPIQGNPLLDIWLELCARSGITEVLINLHAHGQVVEKHLAGKSSPVMVRVVHEKQLLGSAGTIAANQSWIASDPAFWILYADVLTITDLRRMTEFPFLHGRVATVGLTRCPILHAAVLRSPTARESSRVSKKSQKSHAATGSSPDSCWPGRASWISFHPVLRPILLLMSCRA